MVSEKDIYILRAFCSTIYQGSAFCSDCVHFCGKQNGV